MAHKTTELQQLQQLQHREIEVLQDRQDSTTDLVETKDRRWGTPKSPL